MCGIVGGRGQRVVRCIDQMVNLIAHRGPDNADYWFWGDIALGHTRLSIIDTDARSNQPFWDDTGRYYLVYNGEIYNYKAISERLTSRGVTFHTESDTEVLLQALIHFGVSILSELEGIFAFCFFDKHDQSFLLARDKFGVKPLYFYTDDEQFMFGSEFKSFLANPALKTEINLDALYRTILFMYNPGNETPFVHISKVPAGSYALLTADSNVPKIKNYWEWPSYNPVKSSLHADNVLHHLNNAVRQQLVADVPVGAFLSGGVDSSLICALASSIKKENPFATFTMKTDFDYSDGVEDDLPYAQKVARMLKVDLNVVEANPNMIQYLERSVYHLDDIHADPAAINLLLICNLAQKLNYKVLLSGTGGDDLFTGYRRHQAILMERYWIWLPRNFRILLKKLTSLLPASLHLGRRIGKLFRYADLPTNERLLSYHFWSKPDEVRSLFMQPEKLSENPYNFILDEMSRLATADTMELALFLERNYFLKDHNLAYTDKLSMATGVEVRVPFLDTALISAAAKVPSQQKQYRFINKFTLKKAAEQLLPRSIIYRAKTGFGAPLRKWLRGDLASYLDTSLSKDVIMKRGIFNYQVVKKLIDDDRKGVKDNSYTLFALLCIEVWFKTYIDNRESYICDDTTAANNK